MEESLKNCCIAFHDRPDGVFYAGETVSGTVNLSLHKKKKYKEIILRVHGSSETSWSEPRHVEPHHNHNTVATHGSTHPHMEKIIYFSGRETYFKTYTNLIEPRCSDDSAVEYHSGVHKFAFCFALPQNLPSSYEGTHGHVRYEVKVTVKRPHRTDSSYKALLTVLGIINLNLLPNIRLPVNISKSKNFYFLFAKRGLIKMNVQMPHSGYVSGQKICISCNINNSSSVKVMGTKASLIQVITFKANQPMHREKIERKKVTCEFGEGAAKGENKTIPIEMNIPTLSSSTFNYSSLIDIKYFVKIKVLVSGFHGHLTCEFPITLGTVPLDVEAAAPPVQIVPAVVTSPPYSHSMAAASSSSLIGRPAPLPPTSDRTNPPSYDEVMRENILRGEVPKWTMSRSTENFLDDHATGKR